MGFSDQVRYCAGSQGSAVSKLVTCLLETYDSTSTRIADDDCLVNLDMSVFHNHPQIGFTYRKFTFCLTAKGVNSHRLRLRLVYIKSMIPE